MRIGITLLLLVSMHMLFSQKPTVDLSKKDDQRTVAIDAKAIYMSLSEARSQTIEIPFANTTASYTAAPVQSMVPEFYEKYPEIKSYKITKTTDPRVVGRITTTPNKVWVTIMDRDGLKSIYPKDGQHIFDSSEDNHVHSATCSHSTDDPNLNNQEWLKKIKEASTFRGENFSFGDVRRRYRFAVVCTGEYYEANGNSDGAVIASINASIDGFNVIYNSELNVELVGLNPVLNDDANTDPFDPDGPSRVIQAGDAVSAAFNTSSYDIGHVLHNHSFGNGWATGGVAIRGAVCRNTTQSGSPLKAQGWSGSFNNNGFSWISLACHEIAHMFGAPHTFNGTGESCTTAISDFTAYEIGSGTTIMSYQGICETGQNVPSSGEADNYFHVNSLFIMSEYINTQGDCAVEINVNNTAPVVDANPCGDTYTLPRSTPYTIKGSATDAEGDNLTYTWEQYDEDGEGSTSTQGDIGTSASNNNRGPLVRSFPPSATPERTIPRMSTILEGLASDPFEVLSRRNREITFQLTVRDNNPTGGAIASADLVINNISEGPLRTTNPSTVTTGESTTFAWTINGSDEACSLVDVFLSIDNGATYPYLLGTDVAYTDESITLVLPTSIIATDEARIKVECADSECFTFFSISDDFSIVSDCEAELTHICDTEPVSAEQGDPALNLDVSTFVGASVTSITKFINSSAPVDIAIMDDGSGNCEEAFENNFRTARIAITQGGTYTFSADFSAGTPYFSVFEADGYNTNNYCSSYVGSSSVYFGMGSFNPFLGSVSAELEECAEYIIHFYNNAGPSNTSVNIFGPSSVVEINESPNPDYSFTYVAVRDNGIVGGVSTTADFTTLPGGMFEVSSVSYKSGGATPPAIVDPSTWVGQSITTILANGDCLLRSFDSKPVEVISGCGILNIEATDQTDCDPMSNTYLQTFVITYENEPDNGSLNINGVSRPITGSPQTETFIYISDGALTDVNAAFTAQPACSRFEEGLYTAPESCCPLTVDLGDNIIACSDDDILLDAGDEGIAYQWSVDATLIDGATSSTFAPTETGVYEVEVQATTGCFVRDEIDVVINLSPTLSLPDDRSICEGTNEEIIATTNAPFLQWFKDGNILTDDTLITITVSMAGTYVLEGFNSNMCTASDTIIVSAVPAPMVDLGDDQDLCEDEDFILNAGDDGTSYTWFRNGNALADTESTIDVDLSGQYIVNVDNGGGCITSDTVIIQFFPLPQANAGPDKNICDGGDPIEIFYTLQGESFQWFLDGALLLSNDDPLIASEPGEYVLLVDNEIGCTVSDTVVVGLVMPPMVDLGEDIVGCEGSEVVLSTELEGTYIWVQQGSGPISMTSEAVITEAGNYSLIVSNGEGCQGSDMIMVTFEPGPSVELGEDVSICAGETATITAETVVNDVSWLLDGEPFVGQTGTMIQVTEAGEYTAIVEGDSGCRVEDMLTLTVNEVPTVDLGDPQGICDGETVTLLAGVDAESYQWFLNGMEISTDAEVEITEEGEVTIIVKNEFDCEATDAIMINVGENPTLTIEDSYALCAGAEVDIVADSDGTSFEWTVNGTVAGTSGNTITVTESAMVSVIATNDANCTNEASTEVIESELPMVDLGMDQTLCPGDIANLNAGSQSSYLWSNNEISGSINVTNAGFDVVTSETYGVTVTNDANCENSDEVDITFLPELMPEITSSAPGVCGGEAVVLTATGGSTFMWTDPNGTLTDINNESATALPTETTTYSVSATNEQCPGSAVTTTIEIEVFEKSEDISAGEDRCVVLGQSIELEAVGGIAYQWDTSDPILGASDIANPEVNPIEETVYNVMITDENGCTFSDSVTVCILEDPLAEFILVSIITPNDDGDNDRLEFRGLEAFPENKLTIYNRWGNIVFDKARYQQDDRLWDGTNGGAELAADTYYYVLTFNGETYKSPITILR